ncbi:hypothetical protein Tco_0414848 [Tanacetum coccineum]
MVWRYPRPAVDSFSMADVRRLSEHVIKLRDMPKGVLFLSGLSHVWKSRICDLVLWGADGNVMGIHDFLCLPKWTGAKRILLWVLIVVRFLPRLKLLRSERPLLLVPPRAMLPSALVIPVLRFRWLPPPPLCSATVIPSLRNQGRSSAAPVAEGPNTRDFRDKVLWSMMLLHYLLLRADRGHPPIMFLQLGMWCCWELRVYSQGVGCSLPEHFSSGLTDVVVALSPDKKGDGSFPSFASDEEATANPFGV